MNVHCASTACAICATLVLCVLHNSHFFSVLPSKIYPLPPTRDTNNTTGKDNEYANVFALSPDPALTHEEIEESHMQVCIMMEKSVKYLFSTFAEVFSLLLRLPQEDFC